MSGVRIVTSTLLAVAVATANATAAAAEFDATLHAELEQIAHQRIFFGHQSVGENLLDGIRQLSQMAAVPVHIVETPKAGNVPPATFGHAFVEKNGEPLLKLQSFEQAFSQHPAGIDIALLKFCFVDINADTDVKALFSRYRASINRLRAENPGTTFVHVTVPLMEVKGGMKASIRRLLGRAPDGAIENVRREEYNAILRQTYQGREPVFDLARVESTTPDGGVVTVEWNGRVTPALVPAYTDDGGHLNSVGRLRAARELVSVLAAARSRTPGAIPH
ncbi:MAG: hypothetical protein LUO89_02195 [Methanothrix sp.]|nr:hypothetical protein [Methanothrix sp.]